MGIARFEGEDGSDSAEVAVVVDEAWRGVGLASLLLSELGHAGLDRGLHRFTALALADNTGVLGVLRSSGLAYSTKIASGTVEIVMWLEGQPPIDP